MKTETTSELVAGDVVKLANPADAAEAAAVFTVVENRDTRVLIELVCDMRIRPQECVSVSEVVKA